MRILQCVWHADEKLRNFQKSTKYGRFLKFANLDFQISGHEVDMAYAFSSSADQEFDEVFKNAKIYVSLRIFFCKNNSQNGKYNFYHKKAGPLQQSCLEAPISSDL